MGSFELKCPILGKNIYRAKRPNYPKILFNRSFCLMFLQLLHNILALIPPRLKAPIE